MIRKVLDFSIALLLTGCLDPYNPPGVNTTQRYLVVEGFINSGNGPTTFLLSYTKSFADTSKAIPVAEVSLEGKNSGIYKLENKSPGIYQVDQLNLNPLDQYRLHILTSDRKEYLSQYVEVKKSPEIDSVTWDKTPDGVQVKVSTHDIQNITKYYSYDFNETWEFKSFAYSGLKYINGDFESRPFQEQIYTCFRSAKSTIISVASSEQLGEDVIHKFPLTSISASTSDKLSVKYSILVKQHALTKEGYEYWQNLKKMTENIGSLFDPQPATFKGNIYNVADKNEMVLGFVSAGTVTEKRLFITRVQYGGLRVYTGYEGCKLDSVPGNPRSPRTFSPGDIPVSYTVDEKGNPQLLVGSTGCIDCTLKGTTTKPDFWQ